MNQVSGMSVKSAKRVLDIFEILAQYSNGLTIKEVSELLNLPQSSVFNLMKTLHGEGYVSQDNEKKYQLGAKLIHIGTSAMDALDIHAVGKGFLQNLMEQVEETVFMSVLSADELVYVAKIDNNRSIRTTAQPGYRKPLYCTGLGKVFLAFLPIEERERLVSQITFQKITDNTVMNQGELEDQLQTFRKNGYSVDDEENEEGLYCLAAPVYGVGNELKAAISVAGPKERMLSRKEAIVAELLKTANRISKGIGYSDMS